MNPAARTVRCPLPLVLLAAGLAFAAPLAAQETPTPDAPGAYRLSVRDEIEVSIFDEPDLATRQRIDSTGRINLPLIGAVTLAGSTVREAEETIQRTYIDKRILRRPMASVRVTTYATREVSVNGQVASPGMLVFPSETRSLDIVEVISRCGGLTSRANARRVQITRPGPDGTPVVTEVNVEELIARGRGDPVEILPGDAIFVPAKLF